jgi:hypothetical protein
MATYDFELFADYFQFYLQDETAVGDLSDAWTAEAQASRIAVAPGTVGIGAARTMVVPVILEVLSSQPNYSPDEDHIAEAGLTMRSGALVVAGCTDFFPGAARVSLAPG